MIDWGQGVRLWTTWRLPICRISSHECALGAIPVYHRAGSFLSLHSKVCHTAVAMMSFIIILVVARSQVVGWVSWRWLCHSHHVLALLDVNVTVYWRWTNHIHVSKRSRLDWLQTLGSTSTARETLGLSGILQVWCLLQICRRPSFTCH